MGWVLRGENEVSLGVNPENKFSIWERWGLPVKGKIQTLMTKWPALPWRSHGQRLAGLEGRGRQARGPVKLSQHNQVWSFLGIKECGTR